MIYAAVLAGGNGLRMGGEIPKQFLSVAGRPIIIRSIDEFVKSNLIDEIYVAVSKDYFEYTKNLVDKFYHDEKIIVTVGGKNRNETLFNVLKEIERKGMNTDDIILTHDAVRPFIDRRIISDNIDCVKQYGACNTVIPAVDTMVRSVNGDYINSIPARNELYHGQTPQSFNARILLDLYNNLTAEESEIYTDACSVFIKNNMKIHLVKGDRNNIKLTYPEDMEKAEIIIKNREKNK